MRWDALEAVVRMTAMQAQANAGGMTDKQVLAVAALYPEWAPGNYDEGDVRNYDGQTWRCVQAHDSTGNDAWSPGSVAALWAPYHATDPRYARPWIQPTGAHDTYQTGEYMVLDGSIYRCLQDATVHGPAELPAAWEVVAV